MQVILFQPEIPQNTGNIIRTCSVTGCSLVLVRPLGFCLSERQLKRAGLDYIKDVHLIEIEDLENYLKKSQAPFYFFSSKAEKNYCEVKYTKDAILIFGSETSGLPNEFHQKWKEHFVTIPMKKNARCLNLSNSVAIAIYEGLRQENFIFPALF